MSKKEEKKSLAKTLSDSAAQVNREAAGDDFEKLVGELQRDIPKVAVEFHAKIRELEAIGAHKKNARVRYQMELDKGNSEAMELCLKEIRERNEQAEKLKSDLARFPEEIQKLYAQKERIFGLAQGGQVEAASKVREAEKLLKEAAERVRKCYALMGQINELNQSVKEIVREQKKAKEAIEAEIKAPRGADENGFWIEVDDPFSTGTLRHYKKLKNIDDDLPLPFMLNFKDKETSPVDEVRLKASFEKSKALQAEFGDIKSYLDFKGKIIVQVLEMYIVRANGGCDRLRGFAGQFALDKCR